MGMLAGIQKWMPHQSMATEPLRQLLKKNAVFRWSDDLERCLTKIKQELQRGLCLISFSPKKKSYIFTDASHLGMGYVLVQTSDYVEWCFIQCGSTTLTDAQKHYSTLRKRVKYVENKGPNSHSVNTFSNI